MLLQWRGHFRFTDEWGGEELLGTSRSRRNVSEEGEEEGVEEGVLIPWNALYYSALHFTVLQFSLPGARSQRLGARSQGLRVRSQEPGV